MSIIDQTTQRTAAHEAGHSLAGYLAVGKPSSIEIRGETGECLISWPDVLRGELQRSLTYMALIDAAGLEGERLLAGWTPPDPARGDLEHLQVTCEELYRMKLGWLPGLPDVLTKRFRSAARFLLVAHKDALERLARQAETRVSWPAYAIADFIDAELPTLRDHQLLLLGLDWTRRWARLVSKAMHADEQRAAEATRVLLGR
jgi:hypothetical protein